MNRSSFDPDNLGTSGPECGRYVDLLLMMDTDFLSVDERAAMREHLASCAACRVRLAAFAPVDAALQRYVDWLTMEATHSSARLTEEEIMRLAHENTDRSSVPVEPSLHATPPPRPSNPNRFLSGLAAIAAVLLITLGATIFVWFGYGRLSHPGRVTQQPICAPNQISAHLPKDVRLVDLAMISPDEGWIVGATPDPEVWKPLLLHYRHCQWIQEPITLPGVVLYHISVVSAHDVWVLGIKESIQNNAGLYSTLALHYTGGQWQVTPFPVTISRDQDILGFTMVSSTEGWIRVGQRMKAGWGTPDQLYHGVNGVWSLVSAPGYQNLRPVKPFAPGAAWLKAEDSATGHSILLLYHNGNLTPMYTLPAQAFQYEDDGYRQIQMDSPQSAWITLPMSNPRGAQIGWLLLHCSLSSCSQSPLVNDPRIQTSDTVQVFSAHDGWAFGSRNQQGAPAGDIASVFRLHNGQWQSVPWPFQHIVRVSMIVPIGPDEYWALADSSMADSSILHFVNGAWSSYS